MRSSRRQVLATGSALTWAGLVSVRPARADRPSLDAAIRQFTAGATPASGRVRIEIAELVENGNAVPVTARMMGDTNAARKSFTCAAPAPSVTMQK